MGESDDSPEKFEIAPFDLITSETRLRILHAIARHNAESPADPALSFGELREKAGIEDSGNFNYHLDKLQPEYISQTDEGYVPTYAGLFLVGTLRAGIGVGIERGPEPIDGKCRLCDSGLVAVYEDGMFAITCENDHHYPQNGLPSNAVADRDLAQATQLQTTRTQHHAELARQRICPICYDEMRHEHIQADPAEDARFSYRFRAVCVGCGMWYAGPIGIFLYREPAVVSFYHEHGINIFETPFWTLDLSYADPEILDEEPLRLSLSVECDGERLTLTLDEQLQLLDSERESVDTE